MLDFGGLFAQAVDCLANGHEQRLSEVEAECASVAPKGRAEAVLEGPRALPHCGPLDPDMATTSRGRWLTWGL